MFCIYLNYHMKQEARLHFYTDLVLIEALPALLHCSAFSPYLYLSVPNIPLSTFMSHVFYLGSHS